MRYLPACLVALISAAEAQVSLNADLYTTYTDNVFLTASQRDDLIQSAYIDFDYQPDADLSLYYAGSANVFSENADLFNHLHSLGASYARPLGAAGPVLRRCLTEPALGPPALLLPRLCRWPGLCQL